MYETDLRVAQGHTPSADALVPSAMLALVKRSAVPGAQLEEVAVPDVGPCDVLIRVSAASICGTDLHLYEWDEWARGRVRTPLIMGHEFAGEVVAVGSSVLRTEVGTYCTAETHITCGLCYECRHGLEHICRSVQIIGVDRPGAFAQYIAVPERNVWETDRRFPPRIATIQEPMGNAVHTALSTPIAGANVVIFGAGPIGLFAVPIARASGARKIITVEPSRFRLDLARQLGSHVTVDPATENVPHRVMEETGGEGADVILEMSGNQTAIAQSLSVIRSGGHIALLGLPSRPVTLDLTEGVIFKGVTVEGITGRRMFETWYQTRGFLESGMDLSAVITHELPLSQFGDAFRLVRSGLSGKVVLYPNGAPGAA